MIGKTNFYLLGAALLLFGVALPTVAQDTPPGYAPLNSAPGMTATADRPIVVSIEREPQNPNGPWPSRGVHPYSITARDADTWIALVSGQIEEFTDKIKIGSVTDPRGFECYPTSSGPILRGTSISDGSSIWDFAVSGLVLPFQKTPRKTYVNTYAIADAQSSQGKITSLNDSKLVVVRQVIIVPEHN